MSFEIFKILNYSFGGNLVKDYLFVLAVFILIISVLKIFEKIIVARIKKLADNTKNDFDDLLVKVFDSIGWPFYLLLSLYISLGYLNLPEIIAKVVFYIFLVALVYYIVKSIQQIIDYGIKKVVEKKGVGVDSSAIELLTKIVKGVVWAIAIIIVVQNFGYDVSSLVVGLGVGGIAIAFALQNILEDIFSSLSIYFDKPFQTGDFIIVGDNMGTVKKIGMKSTRIQALQGEEIIVSNRELMSTRIQNFKKLEKRRIVFNFGVIYRTDSEKLKIIPNIVNEVMNNQELAELDRVHFKEFGDFSLKFEVVYFINSKEYIDYMDTQQAINLAIKERFEQEEIEMAYPTQTINLNK